MASRESEDTDPEDARGSHKSRISHSELIIRLLGGVILALLIGIFAEWRRMSAEQQAMRIEVVYLKEALKKLPPPLMTQKYDRAIVNGDLEHERIREEFGGLRAELNQLRRDVYTKRLGNRVPKSQFERE